MNTWALLRALTLPEWRAHPLRQGLALLAVALGVALAFSVHLINQSALAEFSAAVRAANGEPDAALVCTRREGCDDALADALASNAAIALASPVVEIDSVAIGRNGQRIALKLVGVDGLQVAAVAPALLPRAVAGSDRSVTLDPDAIFVNASAQQRLAVKPGDTLQVQHGLATVALRVAGQVAAGGAALAVIDIAGAQTHFGFNGRLTRIDLRLAAGARVASLATELPPGWTLAAADDATQRMAQVSRAYRVNLTVLALVALLVGAFLVFSVLALAVAQRTPGLALLGVLGLAGAERGRLVLAECAVLGVVGSAIGVGAGTLLAQAGLQWLAGDLGGGYFPGVAPALAFSWPGALAFAALGTVAALVGGWLPARQATALAPAQALKGLGGSPQAAAPWWRGPLLLAAGALLALVPPIGGLPIGAYAAVALLLVGGIACVPSLIDALLRRAALPTAPLALLALQRARHERDAATVAVAGVVASLALAVALTVMVASFREGVSGWLDTVLPADLYVRTAAGSAASDQAFLPPGFATGVAALPGVARMEASRTRALTLDPARPAVSLIARPLADPARRLPLLAAALPASGAMPGVYVSEATAALYDAGPGQTLDLPIGSGSAVVKVQVLGVWRDYARQFGAIAIDSTTYQHLTGDWRSNDLALWLAPGARSDEVQRAVRSLAGEPALLDFATPTQLRALSLSIFDRSFAVTYYLQAVAIAIGLTGIAASFSAQVLARRREFGLLAHLGLTRAQIVGVVAGEGAAWTAAGALAGLALGLAVAVVLVHVVNPQSFHWTMELLLPWGRLASLCAAVLLAGSATAALSARAAASQDAVAAVKEDW
ncbi:MAG: FtsX-like permease family protein [Burkholderiaceae bacterium]|nr:FtsX-like permease family protein [Burkholderiaceae bacterium]